MCISRQAGDVETAIVALNHDAPTDEYNDQEQLYYRVERRGRSVYYQCVHEEGGGYCRAKVVAGLASSMSAAKDVVIRAAQAYEVGHTIGELQWEPLGAMPKKWHKVHGAYDLFVEKSPMGDGWDWCVAPRGHATKPWRGVAPDPKTAMKVAHATAIIVESM